MRLGTTLAATLALGALSTGRAATVTPYAGPLFDAHCHFIRPVDARGRAVAGVPASPPQLFEALRRTGVTGVFFYGPPENTLTLRRAFGDFVVPFAEPPIDKDKHELAMTADTARIIDAALAAGARGVGEIPLRHRPSFHGAYRGYPGDGPHALAVYAVAARHQVPVTVHLEEEFSEELDRALAKSRDTTIIWAHAGDGPASKVQALMQKYPNLYADISTRNPFMKLGRPQDEQRLTGKDGTIQRRWKEVLEQFSDRFLYGLDLTDNDRLAVLQQVTAYYRSVLGQIAPEAAAKIAYQNARRLAGK